MIYLSGRCGVLWTSRLSSSQGDCALCSVTTPITIPCAKHPMDSSCITEKMCICWQLFTKQPTKPNKQNPENNQCWLGCAPLVEMQYERINCCRRQEGSSKKYTELLNNPVIPLLGIHPQKFKVETLTDIYLYTNVYCIICNIQKAKNNPSIHE